MGNSGWPPMPPLQLLTGIAWLHIWGMQLLPPTMESGRKEDTDSSLIKLASNTGSDDFTTSSELISTPQTSSLAIDTLLDLEWEKLPSACKRLSLGRFSLPLDRSPGKEQDPKLSWIKPCPFITDASAVAHSWLKEGPDRKAIISPSPVNTPTTSITTLSETASWALLWVLLGFYLWFNWTGFLTSF